MSEAASPFELSDEQRQVVHGDHSSLVVSASAGAGKTGVLVEKYLRHVESGWSPSEILTITFTKKAAAEMKRRIVRRLRERGLFEAAQNAETGPIQTIHSFCERLLRENALEAGLDPKFEVDASESGASILECVRDTLAHPSEHPSVEKLIRTLVGSYQRGQSSPYALLEETVVDTLQALRHGGADLVATAELYASPELALASWQEAVLDSLENEVREQFQIQERSAMFQEKLVAAFKATGKGRVAWAAMASKPETELETAEFACGLVTLACEAWARYERRMEQRQTLDFAALESRAVRLLQTREAARKRVQSAYRLVMVDEAQDVNPSQHQLIDALRIECELLVGDSQQSIYGFRHADLRLFQQKALTTENLSLTQNYRSRPGILRFVDTIFSRLWDGYQPMLKDSPGGFEGVEIWTAKELDSRFVAHSIKCLIDEGYQAKQIAILIRASYQAPRLMSALAEFGVQARLTGGTEKFYTRLEVRDLSNALRALVDPYDEFSFLAMLRSPFVGLSLDAIAMLALEKPAAETLGVIGDGRDLPFDEDDQGKIAFFVGWFKPLAARADRLTAWEVISELFASSPLLENLARRPRAEQTLPNVRKLLTLATQTPELGPLEFAEKIREIQTLRHREGDAPATDADADLVTLMTIHKSKGLEFDVVVLPDLYASLTKAKVSVEKDAPHGLIVPQFGTEQCVFYRWLADRRKQKELQEAYRVAYVALTRAREKLCVCMHPDARDHSLARLLARTLGLGRDELPGAVMRSADDPS